MSGELWFLALFEGQNRGLRKHGPEIEMRATITNCMHCVRAAPRLAGRGLVAGYRYTLSPRIGFHCRHLPTCSAYADEALDRYGLWAGGWMTLARLCRCHPYGTSGLDFVPQTSPREA